MPSVDSPDARSTSSLACVTTSVCYSYDYDGEQFVGTDTPILVVGTKYDLAEQVREKGRHRASSVAEECGADEINIVSESVWPLWIFRNPTVTG